jgi:hypothetical protein
MVEEPATAQAKEETSHSWNALDAGAPATLGSFARTERKRRSGGKPEGGSNVVLVYLLKAKAVKPAETAVFK